MAEWSIKSASLVALAAILALAASSHGQTSDEQCTAGLEIIGLESALNASSSKSCAVFSTSWEGCCGNALVPEGDEEPMCRTAITSSAFCESDRVPGGVTCATFEPNETMSVVFDVTMTYPDASETCCQKCKCYGDPLCEAFDGSHDEMIECDARDFGTCTLSEDICKEQFDHAGNQCKWLKNNDDYPWWNSNLEDGSPCQADYAVSGQLELVMLDVDGMKLSTLVGERGVQTDVMIELPGYDGSFHLNSDDCFDFDPRDVGEGNAGGAWTLPPSATEIPRSWTVSTPNDVEIRWQVRVPTLGLSAEVVCNKAIGATRSRLDILNVTDTQGRTTGEGYCFSGVIDTKSQRGTNLNNADGHYKCLELALPDIVTTCKALTDNACYARTISGWQQYWCQTAELQFTAASVGASSYEGMVSKCLADIRSGSIDEQTETWATYACEMNSILPYGTAAQQSYVTECLQRLEENGWYPWAETYQGVIMHEWTVSKTCKSSIDDFLEIPADDSCASGLMVEVLIDGAWVPKLYFPPESPPCADAFLEATGDRFPEFFMYQIRMRQCGLDTECLVKAGGTECRPLVAIDIDLTFNTEVCSAEESSCSECAISGDVPPEVCASESGDVFELGFCEECCDSNNFAPGEENQTCRELTMETPFCDESDATMSGYCERLKRKSTRASLTLNFTAVSSTMECCATCAMWGDPYGEAFDGSREKLIVCDSRDDTCFSQQGICDELVDHAGNPCVWNQTVKDLIGSHRGNIGAYGSPCLADFAKSGDNEVLMYETSAPYRLSFYTGERSILNKLLLTTPRGEYTLDAEACYADDPMDGWTTISGEDVGTALELTYTGAGEDGYGEDERVWAVFERDLGIFFRVTCVNSMAVTTSHVGGYRLNVEHLIDTTASPASADGYCVTGDMRAYGGNYTVNPKAEACEDGDLADDHEACKAFWSGACTPDQIELGIENWCETANQDKPVARCVRSIMKSRPAKTAKAWAQAVCTALLPFKMEGDTDRDFIRECMELGETEDYYAIVRNWNSTGDRATVQSKCVSSVAKYTTRDKSDACVSGISVQYNPGSGWTELFFIPSNMMPCNGVLEVDAWRKKYWPLFAYPVRFEQCDVLNEDGACPASANVEATCMSSFSFAVSMSYTHNDVGCPVSGGDEDDEARL